MVDTKCIRPLCQISRLNLRANGWMVSLHFQASPQGLGVEEDYKCLTKWWYTLYREYLKYWASINSFPFAIMLEVGGQNALLHVAFLPYQRRWNCRTVLAVRVGLREADLELMRLNAVPSKCHTIHREVFPRPTFRYFTQANLFFDILALQVLICLHHLYKEISLLQWSLKICQGKYLCKGWYCIFILYLICNAFSLTYFLTHENEE